MLAGLGLIGLVGCFSLNGCEPEGDEAYARSLSPEGEPDASAPVTPEAAPDSDAYTGEKYLWNEAANHVGPANATDKLMGMSAAAEAMGMQADVVDVLDEAGNVTGYSIPEVVLEDGTVLTDPADRWNALNFAEDQHAQNEALTAAAAEAQSYWNSVGARV